MPAGAAHSTTRALLEAHELSCRDLQVNLYVNHDPGPAPSAPIQGNIPSRRERLFVDRKETGVRSREDLLAVLADAPRLRTAALEVLESSEYPTMMSLGDRLVRNPVWGAPQRNVIHTPVSERLRGHMFLAVAEPPRMNPHIYCYKSERWNAYLIPFFKYGGDAQGCASPAHALNEHVTSRYRSHAMPTNKIVVSVKPNEEHPGELWLYVFEFYSLVLPIDFEFSNNSRWIDLERLSDPFYREAAVNGDIIRAIRAHFGTDMHQLERSHVSLESMRFGNT